MSLTQLAIGRARRRTRSELRTRAATANGKLLKQSCTAARVRTAAPPECTHNNHDGLDRECTPILPSPKLSFFPSFLHQNCIVNLKKVTPAFAGANSRCQRSVESTAALVGSNGVRFDTCRVTAR